MAQADSVRSSSRQLITGESANQSTSLRAIKPPAALKLPMVSVQPVDRRYLIGGSDARVTVGRNEAPLLWFWRERRPDVGPADLSNCRWYAVSTGQEPLGSNIGALSFETVGFLLGRLLWNILIQLRIRSRNKHLRLSAFDGVSSNQLVPSKRQNQLVRSKSQGRRR
jgi:hypothetical protein